MPGNRGSQSTILLVFYLIITFDSFVLIRFILPLFSCGGSERKPLRY